MSRRASTVVNADSPARRIASTGRYAGRHPARRAGPGAAVARGLRAQPGHGDPAFLHFRDEPGSVDGLHRTDVLRPCGLLRTGRLHGGGAGRAVRRSSRAWRVGGRLPGGPARRDDRFLLHPRERRLFHHADACLCAAPLHGRHEMAVGHRRFRRPGRAAPGIGYGDVLRGIADARDRVRRYAPADRLAAGTGPDRHPRERVAHAGGGLCDSAVQAALLRDRGVPGCDSGRPVRHA